MQRHTVSIFLHTLRVGGAEKVLVALANSLIVHYENIELVVMELDGPLIDSVHERVKIIDLKSPNYRRATLEMARYYERAMPSVVLTSLYPTGLAAIAAKVMSRSKTKVLVGAHNSLRAKFVSPDTRKDRLLLKPLCRFLFPRADGFIAVSKGVADELIADFHIPSNRMKVIYNPVITADFPKRMTEAVHHPWLGAKKERTFKTIVTVGRLVKQKGYDILLKAFSFVTKKQQCKLIFVGTGPLLEPLKLQVKALHMDQHVDFVGYQENPLKYMYNADLFVLSSRWEGLPTVLIEALACGCPVVATDCMHGPSEILGHGEFGKLAMVDNPASLSTEILSALTTKPEIKHPLRRRLEDFKPDCVTHQFVDFFNNVIDESQRF
jgi:glycosyltransferase involved in cell wall biosynthesis